jgi:hypothetical protein
VVQAHRYCKDHDKQKQKPYRPLAYRYTNRDHQNDRHGHYTDVHSGTPVEKMNKRWFLQKRVNFLFENLYLQFGFVQTIL